MVFGVFVFVCFVVVCDIFFVGVGVFVFVDLVGVWVLYDVGECGGLCYGEVCG